MKLMKADGWKENGILNATLMEMGTVLKIIVDLKMPTSMI